MFPALRKTAISFVIFAALILVVTSRNTSARDKRQPAFAAPVAAQDAPPAWCKVTVSSDGNFTPPQPTSSYPQSSPEYWAAPWILQSYGTMIGKGQFWFGGEKLWTMLPVDGTWRAWRANSSPNIPGEFAYDNKFPWFHQSETADSGPLTVTGRRLDGLAPTFTERDWMTSLGRTPDGVEALMGGIEIPTFGCWQVTGHYREQNLRFTVWVEPRPSEYQSREPSQPTAVSTALPIVKVDGADEAKLLVYSVTPEVPPAAKSGNISGSVVLHAIIDRGGRPQELEYVSGPPLLAQAAINAAEWQQYRIERMGVELDTTIDIVFQPASH